ncbi:MAG: TlpA disulfide reductase family protein [Desulfobacterales bacterium]|jgi:peroxiredoxin
MNAKEIQKDQKTNLQSVVIIVLIVILIGILILLQTKDFFSHQTDGSGLANGLPAPNFTLPDPDGQMVGLTDFRGKVVLLNIWATWCPPCVEEMPSMEKLYQELKDEDFEILAVSIDESGAQDVLPFMKKHKLSFPVLLDAKGTIMALYRTTGVPESFIIDKDRILVEKVIGPRDWASADAIRFFRNLIQRD